MSVAGQLQECHTSATCQLQDVFLYPDLLVDNVKIGVRVFLAPIRRKQGLNKKVLSKSELRSKSELGYLIRASKSEPEYRSLSPILRAS